jgi:carbon-monoxide dehydrogenase large subunit
MIAFGVGTYASRNAVVAGSAALVAARAVRDKARRLAAHLLEVGEGDLALAGGALHVVGAPDRRRTLAELAAACVPGSPLPEGMEPGLEATRYFAAPRPTFASGVHAAVVEVERETGRLTIVDYVVASDAGPLLNPRIVEGQVHGGVAQGLGGALFEELAYDDQGQPRAQTLMEYVMPAATQVPAMRIAHLATPSPLNPLGVKGIGEAGCVGAPPAVMLAVLDALKPLGVEQLDMPATAHRVWQAIQSARK